MPAVQRIGANGSQRVTTGVLRTLRRNSKRSRWPRAGIAVYVTVALVSSERVCARGAVPSLGVAPTDRPL